MTIIRSTSLVSSRAATWRSLVGWQTVSWNLISISGYMARIFSMRFLTCWTCWVVWETMPIF